MTQSPCSWPILRPNCDRDENGEPVDDWYDDLPDDVRLAAESAATEYLWNWSGQRFGVCPVDIEISRNVTGNTYDGSSPNGRPSGRGVPWQPVLLGGRWYNISCGSCGTSCSCTGGSCDLIIPGPVSEIIAIEIDGEILDPADYELFGARIVRRVDGGLFPNCGAAVSYLRGIEVPVGGQIAAGRLSEEFARLFCRDEECALPSNLQNVTRQGISIDFGEDPESADRGDTGIFEVDSWIRSVILPKRRGTIRSPDYNPAVRNLRKR